MVTIVSRKNEFNSFIEGKEYMIYRFEDTVHLIKKNLNLVYKTNDGVEINGVKLYEKNISDFKDGFIGVLEDKIVENGGDPIAQFCTSTIIKDFTVMFSVSCLSEPYEITTERLKENNLSYKLHSTMSCPIYEVENNNILFSKIYRGGTFGVFIVNKLYELYEDQLETKDDETSIYKFFLENLENKFVPFAISGEFENFKIKGN